MALDATFTQEENRRSLLNPGQQLKKRNMKKSVKAWNLCGNGG